MNKQPDSMYPTLQDLPLIPERLVPRLGDFLVSENLITAVDLQNALDQQARLSGDGQHVLIGQVMVQLGIVDRDTLDSAVTRQIYQLHAALERTNQALEKRVDERTSELRQALSKLNELNQLKANFMSNVSHELRMPLQYLLGYLDLLGSETLGPLTTDQGNAVVSLKNSSQRLKHLIEDMLEFSKLMTHSNLPVDLAPTSIDERIRAAVDHVLPKAKMRNVMVNTTLADQLPPVNADGKRITWVVGQLLDNAIKFTPSGGEVGVQTSPNGSAAVITVTDTGIGIPESRFHEIFEPFHQLDGSATRKYGGTGLGLALARTILEAHGSSINVHSQVGQGSRFAFALPFYSRQKPASS